jgi:hypothetical protein
MNQKVIEMNSLFNRINNCLNGFMSVATIKQILEQGVGIDVLLGEDQLSSILRTVCDLITAHEEDIASLRIAVARTANQTEVMNMISRIDADVKTLQQDLTSECESLHQTRDSFAAETTQRFEQVTNSVTSQKEELRSDFEKRIKECQGDHFLVSEMTKSLHRSVTEMQEGVAGMREEVIELKKSAQAQMEAEQGAIQFVRHLELLDGEFKAYVTDAREIQKETNRKVTIFSEEAEKWRKDAVNKFQSMSEQITELRYLVIDAPSFELDGVLSSEAIVRAIQRDSRRIDHFNQLVLSVKEENDRLHDTFNDMSTLLTDFQIAIQTFVIEHNTVKAALINQVDHSYVCSENVRQDVAFCQQSLEEISDVTMKSIGTVSGAFLQLWHILNRMSTRAVPLFESFDDELLQLHRVNEVVMAQKEHRLSRPDLLSQALIKSNNRTTTIGLDLTDDLRESLIHEFSIRLFEVPIHEKEDGRKRGLSQKRENGQDGDNGDRSRRMTGSMDLEVRQSLGDLHRKIEKLTQSFERMRGDVGAQIETKAETSHVERILEKVRSMVSTSREDLMKIRKKMTDFIERDDLESLVKDMVGNKVRTDGNVAAVPQPRLGISCYSVKPIIPDLQTQTPHEQLFGSTDPKQTKKRPH